MRQYNQMSLALADITASGGARADDQLLISFFENSLPIAYATIRQMVRYQQHDNFDEYYNDFLTQVKAEERAAQLNSNAAAFAATTHGRVDGQQLKPRNTRGGQEYKGSKPGNDRNETRNPCFNCGQFDHLRKRCPCPAVTCSHCGANHLNELCSKGPGGELRDSSVLMPGCYWIGAMATVSERNLLGLVRRAHRQHMYLMQSRVMQ